MRVFLALLLMLSAAPRRQERVFTVDQDGTVRLGDQLLLKGGMPRDPSALEGFLYGRRDELSAPGMRIVFVIDPKATFDKVVWPVRTASQVARIRRVIVRAGDLEEPLSLLAPPPKEPAVRLRTTLCARGNFENHATSYRKHLEDAPQGEVRIRLGQEELAPLTAPSPETADSRSALFETLAKRASEEHGSGPVVLDCCEGTPAIDVLLAHRALSKATGAAVRITLPGYGPVGYAPPEPEPSGAGPAREPIGRFGASVPGDTGAILGLAFAPDGRHIVSAGTDKAIRVWDAVASKQLLEIPEDAGSVAFSPDGRHLVSGGWSGKNAATLWDAAKGTPVRSFTCDPRHSVTGNVRRIEFSPDGKTVVGWVGEGSLRLWDAASSRELVKPSTGSIVDLSLSPDGKTLALAGAGDARTQGPGRPEQPRPAEVRLWSLEKRAALGALAMEGKSGETAWPRFIVFSPDGTLLAALCSDEIVRVWDVGPLTLRHSLDAKNAGVEGIRFSKDGRTILAPARLGACRAWDAGSGKQAFRDDAKRALPSPDGSILALSFVDRDDAAILALREVASGRDRSLFRGPKDGVVGVSFSADGSRIAAGSLLGRIRVWDTKSSKLLLEVDQRGPAGAEPVAVALSADGKTVAARNLSGGPIVLRDSETGKESSRMTLAGAAKGEGIPTLEFSPDGKSLHLKDGGGLRLMDVASGREVFRSGGTGSLEFSRDGKSALARDPDATCLILVETGGEVWRGRDPARFDPDGATLRAAVSDFVVVQVDSISGRERGRTRMGGGPPESVAFPATGGMLAASPEPGGGLHVWDVPTGRSALGILPGPESPGSDRTRSAALSPDGDTLGVWLLEKGKVRLWDVKTGREGPTLEATVPGPPGMPRSILLGSAALSFSADGKILVASAASGRSLQAWDMDSRKPLFGTEGGRSLLVVDGVQPPLSPDGRLLADHPEEAGMILKDVTRQGVAYRLAGAGSRIERVFFSADGSRIAVTSGGSFILWTLR